MDTAVGVMLLALLVITLIGDITGLSYGSNLWFLVNGAELALFFSVLIKYFVTLVA